MIPLADLVCWLYLPLVLHGHATHITDQLAQHWAVSVISFPKDRRFKLLSKEDEIFSKFNGRNVPELAREYDMTERGMYKLIARVRKRMLEDA